MNGGIEIQTLSLPYWKYKLVSIDFVIQNNWSNKRKHVFFSLFGKKIGIFFLLKKTNFEKKTIICVRGSQIKISFQYNIPLKNWTFFNKESS